MNNNLFKKRLIAISVFLLTLSCFMHGVSIAADKLKYGSELLRVPDLPSRPHHTGNNVPATINSNHKHTQTETKNIDQNKQSPEQKTQSPVQDNKVMTEADQSNEDLKYDLTSIFHVEFREGEKCWSGPFQSEKYELRILHEWEKNGPADLGFLCRIGNDKKNWDNFSIRWVGKFEFAAGKHKFFLSADDYACLLIDGKKAAEVIWSDIDDEWTSSQGTAHHGKIFEIDMPDAGFHTIEYRYSQHIGNARAVLEWSPNQQYGNVPVDINSSLKPAEPETNITDQKSNDPSTVDPSDEDLNYYLQSFIWDLREGEKSWSSGKLTSPYNHEQYISHEWKMCTMSSDDWGYPDSKIVKNEHPDKFSVRWVGNFPLRTGKHKFFLSANDYACLLINGKKVAEVSSSDVGDEWPIFYYFTGKTVAHRGKIFEINVSRTGFFQLEYRYSYSKGKDNPRTVLDWSPDCPIRITKEFWENWIKACSK